jgi:hypothetical protein
MGDSNNLGGREERFDLTLDGTKTYLSTDGCGTRVIDLETRQERLLGKKMSPEWLVLVMHYHDFQPTLSWARL